MLAPRSSPMLEEEALIGRPPILIQTILSHSPYCRPFLHPHHQTVLCRCDRDRLIVCNLII